MLRRIIQINLKKIILIGLLMLLYSDYYYTIRYKKLSLYNNSKITRYESVRTAHYYKKNIKTIQTNMMDFTNFDWNYIKKHTCNLTTPCVFQFQDSDKFNKILTKVENEIANKKVQIHDKSTLKYDTIKYKDYNPAQHIIFNHTLNKSILDYDLSYVLFCNYFKSNNNDVTGIHNEINSTLNLQIKSRKKWILVDPDNSDMLYPMKQTWRNYVTKFGKSKIKEDILKTIPHYEHILTPNQILFVPSWWWHHVISMEDNTESLSIRTVPPLSICHKYFLPKTISSFVMNMYLSFLYNNDDFRNKQGDQLNNIDDDTILFDESTTK